MDRQEIWKRANVSVMMTVSVKKDRSAVAESV